MRVPPTYRVHVQRRVMIVFGRMSTTTIASIVDAGVVAVATVVGAAAVGQIACEEAAHRIERGQKAVVGGHHGGGGGDQRDTDWEVLAESVPTGDREKTLVRVILGRGDLA